MKILLNYLTIALAAAALSTFTSCKKPDSPAEDAAEAIEEAAEDAADAAEDAAE